MTNLSEQAPDREQALSAMQRLQNEMAINHDLDNDHASFSLTSDIETVLDFTHSLLDTVKELTQVLEKIEPDKLRYIAKSLDILTGFVGPMLEQDLITRSHKPLSKEERDILLDWVNGTDQQDDLRRWADTRQALASTNSQEPE